MRFIGLQVENIELSEPKKEKSVINGSDVEKMKQSKLPAN